MKKVTVAKSAGFCFGVKRAIDMVYAQAEKSTRPIYTYGPIIHNEEVVKDLESKQVYMIEDLDELDQKEKGIVIIRSHGVAKQTYETIKEKGFQVIDATCPFVLKIHKIVEKHSKDGYHIIIIGNDKHAEVEGIKGWCNPDETTVIENVEETKNLNINNEKNVCIVSQTTFNNNKFQELVEIIQKKGYNIIVLNTICSATQERQTQAKELAAKSDAMIVIGGKQSSNTQKLFEISKKECENTYYIQTIKDLDLTRLKSTDNVGITAGASTPNNIIEEVQKNVRNEF